MSAIVGFLFMVPVVILLWVMVAFVVYGAYKIAIGEGGDLLP